MRSDWSKRAMTRMDFLVTKTGGSNDKGKELTRCEGDKCWNGSRF